MKWNCSKLFGIIIVGLLVISISATVASAGVNVVLHDGDARNFADPPDVIAYANTQYTTPPSDFQITTAGSIWRYHQWIALMEVGNHVEAKTTVETTSVGVQLWGDTNDGWARVLVDGSEVWTGSVYGSDINYPGGAFVKYLEISGLDKSTHTIRVENMGTSGAHGGNDVTIMFFGLEETSETPISTSKGLVAHYTFDRNYEDSSIYNNHGTPKGNMDFTTGMVGNAAASFDGKSYVEVSDSDSLDITDDFTFSVWLNKQDAGVGGWAVVFSKGDTSSTSSSNSPYALHHSGGKYPMIRISGNTISSNTDTDFNEWYFLTVTREGSDVKFYIDGELKDTKISGVSIPKSQSKLLIGIDPPGSTEYFKGAMDDLRIYNYALTQSEVKSLYGGEITSTTPISPTSTNKGLVAHYTFDRNYEDSSIYNNHGTPKGNMDFTTGVVGNAAASFDGKSYVEVSDSDSLDLTDDFTFSAWLNKQDAGVGGWAVVFSKGDTSSLSASNSPYALAHQSNGKYPIIRISGNTISSNTDTDFNEWYLLTVTREGSDVKFYIDGELKDTKTSGVSILKSQSKLVIGTDPPGTTEYFKGAMDELRIYNYALTQSEVKSLYGGEITPPPPVDLSGLTFESRSRSSGSTVQIPLTLNGIDENIGNMDITLGYDSSVLEATEVIKGGLTTNSLFDSNIVDGTIMISLADKVGFSGDGSIAYIKFDVIGAEGSSSPLEITKLSANRAEDLVEITIPTQDGMFKVIAREEGLGDGDGDGKLTALDALYALQMAVGKIPEDLTLDMNGDGKVSSIDARKILRIAAGLEKI